MTNHLPLLVCCTAALSCQFELRAQAIDHFNENGARWYVADVFPNGSMGNPGFMQTETTVYSTVGDTLIDGQVWKKLVSSADPSLEEGVVYEGLVRSEGLQVYYRNPAGIEALLYDFGLEEGDLISIEMEAGEGTMEVAEVDFVEINGNSHRRIAFGEPDLPTPFMWMAEVWIEGIGSVHGPLFADAPHWVYGEFNTALELTCTSRNEMTYWNHPDFDDCVVNIINSSREAVEQALLVFPNPFSEALTLVGLDEMVAGPAALRVFDLQGRQVYAALLPQGQERVYLGQLPAGIYLLEVESGHSRTYQRIVKQP